MGKKLAYFCDNCKENINDKEQLLKESIPTIAELHVIDGRNNIELAYLGEKLVFSEQELCSKCYNKYKQIWTDAMINIAYDWKQN